MLRKIALGLIAAASLGVVALAPGSASAHGFHSGWGWGYGFPGFYGGFYPYYAAYPYPAYYPPPPPVYSQQAVYYAPRTVHRTYRRVRHRQHCTCSPATSS